MPEGSRVATKFDTINYTYMNSIVLGKRAIDYVASFEIVLHKAKH